MAFPVYTGEKTLGRFCHVAQRYHLHSKVLWCPGAESNHRHEDFQSTALPLSYPGTGNASAFGCACLRRARATCPEGLAKFSMWLRPLFFRLFQGPLDIIGILGRHRVISAQPFAKIHICAALRTERAKLRIGRLLADRTRHEATSFRAMRSRLRCNSKWPRGVHPTKAVSTTSARKAARSVVSNWRRSFLGIGAGSITICPPRPRRRNWRGRSLAAARLALKPAAGEVSPPVFTSTAIRARVGSTTMDAPPPSGHSGWRKASI